ncbi:MAG TPA: hypothetical protein DCP92_05880 [Nitrospiraceae bacterium]|nr:hypothetical protein [Nitrospiraceae bacterium]
MPKCRQGVLRGTIVIRLRQLLREACQMHRWQIHAMRMRIDHR